MNITQGVLQRKERLFLWSLNASINLLEIIYYLAFSFFPHFLIIASFNITLYFVGLLLCMFFSPESNNFFVR